MKSKSNFLINVLIILFYIIIAMQFINYNLLSIYMEYSKYIFLPFFILGIIILTNRGKIVYLRDIIMIIFLGLFLLISLLYTKDNIVASISILYMPIAILFFSLIKWDNKYLKILMYMFFAIGLWNCYLARNAITLYYSNPLKNFNPNTVAQTLLICTIFINTISEKLKIRKIVTIFVTIIFVYSIYILDSRASLMAVTAFLCMRYIIPKKIYSKKTLKIMFIIILTIGTIFPFFYTTLYNNGISFTFLFSEKKLYTGREKLWSDALAEYEYTPEAWILGKGSELYPTLHAHNAYFHILTMFGVFIYIIYFYLLFTKINRFNYFVIGWLAMMVHGYAELSWISRNVFIWVAILLGIANSLEQNNTGKVEKVDGENKHNCSSL